MKTPVCGLCGKEIHEGPVFIGRTLIDGELLIEHQDCREAQDILDGLANVSKFVDAYTLARAEAAEARAEAAEARVEFLEKMIRIFAERNEVIPEEVLLVSNREPTEAEREYGRSLIGVDAADEE